MPKSFGSLPATALSPMVGMLLPSKLHTWAPPSSSTIFGPASWCLAGRRSVHTFGCSITWSSTEITCTSSGSMHQEYTLFHAWLRPVRRRRGGRPVRHLSLAARRGPGPPQPGDGHLRAVPLGRRHVGAKRPRPLQLRREARRSEEHTSEL